MNTGTTLAEDLEPDSGRNGPLRQSTHLAYRCNVVFPALGLLMLVAAGFKTNQTYSQPMSTLGVIGTLALVCFELSFGTWLVIGVRSKWTLRAAVACFVLFASVSGYMHLIGAPSCGCFGTVRVNPVITLVVDVVAAILLCWCRSGVEIVSKSKLCAAFSRFAPVAVVLSLFATSISLYGQSRFAQSDSSMTTAGGFVILEPTSWTGKRWPLLGASVVPAELAIGTWDVLLFRHDCHLCHDVMLEIEQLLLMQGESERIALIGIDNQGTDGQSSRVHELGCLLAYLPQDREWFATTPLRVRLTDGICVSASVIEHWGVE